MVKRLLPDAIAFMVLVVGVSALPYGYPLDRSGIGDFVGHAAAYIALAVGCVVLRLVVRRVLGVPPTAR